MKNARPASVAAAMTASDPGPDHAPNGRPSSQNAHPWSTSRAATASVSPSAICWGVTQVADAAQVPLGVPLLQQDRRAIATGVHSLAPVREVEVVRSWPHTLGIRVAERTPSVAFVVNGGFMLVDSQGVGYAQVPELPKDVLLARGDSSAPGITAAVGRTLGTLPADVRDQVRGVGADSPVKVSLDLDEKRVVVWGGPDDPELKARVLAVLLEQAPSATVYDVSAPAFPATR